MLATADIYITVKRSENFYYQTIRIVPSKKSHLRYFMYDKYHAAREVEKVLDEIYLGNGIDICFRDRNTFRNQTVIKYEIINDIPIEIKEKKFRVEANVPRHDGCMFCEHLRRSKSGKDRCAYYKKFLDKHKVFCSDFSEKD